MFDLSSKIVSSSRFRRDRMDNLRRRQGKPPRLDRRNAAKNIEYDGAASWSSSPAAAESPTGLRTTRSLDLSPAYSSQTSFRIGGVVEGEFDLLCRSLGLSGPEDFAIPAAAWAASKARCSSGLPPPSRLLHLVPPAPSAPPSEPPPPESNLEARGNRGPTGPSRAEIRGTDAVGDDLRSPVSAVGGDGGIRGARPPVLTPPAASALPPPPSRLALAPPPSMSLPVLDKACSSWDLVRSFAPEVDGGGSGGGGRRSFSSDDDDDDGTNDDDEDDDDVCGGAGEGEVRLGETAVDLTVSCSSSTSNEDDSSSTTTEAMLVISPNGRFRRNIRSWMRGGLLGSGSFGTVYEGISDDGIFFAVKEVSLLDQGTNARQCILQLEQEIALLSQFEHENIVQYYGTDKEEAKLFIFLELVTQGSLASLYKRYQLQDSQVSAYTRQILNGLKFLHDRNVVHRDIKCANILVHANGSVKLADFGLAKEITKLNVLKSCKGSVYWMAPEVVNPKRTYGPAADIWSLGCTVLEMLTQQIPYPNLEWTQALYRIGRGERPRIPNSLSRDAKDFIRRCVHVNPDDRPSASQLLEHPFVRRPLPSSARSSDSSPQSNGRWS